MQLSSGAVMAMYPLDLSFTRSRKRHTAIGRLTTVIRVTQKEIDIMQKKQQPKEKEPMGKGKGLIRKRGNGKNC
jgi:hypothetical protein